jgi:hypothetical protein
MSVNYKELYDIIDFDKIFKGCYVDPNNKYIINESVKILDDYIDYYIDNEDKKLIKKIVNTYDIFNAIILYQNTYDENFHLDNSNYINTYIPLCYEIIYNIIICNDMFVNVKNKYHKIYNTITTEYYHSITLNYKYLLTF